MSDKKKAKKKHHTQKKSKKSKKTKSKIIKLIILIILIGAVYGLLKHTSKDRISGNHTTAFGVVDVDLYVMSQCPYGLQVENAILPVVKELGPALKVNVEYIARDNGDGTFSSLHGQPEVEGNIVQLCAKKYYPAKYLDFIVCQNSNPRNLTANIDSCATKTGINPVKIKNCTFSSEGQHLLRESIKKSEVVNAQGSPTIYMSKKIYSSGRDTTALKRAICSQLPKHPSCSNMPSCSSDADCFTTETGKVGICENPGKSTAKCTLKEDAKVNLVIVNSKDCKDCDTIEISSILKQMFPALSIKTVDAASESGKQLISKFNLQNAPSFVFDNRVSQTYTWKNNAQLASNFKKSGDFYLLSDSATGAKFILDKKKRDTLNKKVGVVKGDNKPQIDFYVMSYCPYGNLAEEAIEPVYQLLKGKADFNPHYVIYSNYQGGGPKYCLDKDSKYCSMHGIQELNQNIREQCVDKYMGIDSYFKFVLEMNKKCNYQNADTCWTAVAKGLSLDTTKISKCEKEEGLTFVKNDLELNTLLGVRGSPTVFVDGQQFSGERNPAGYGKALCAAFDTKPTECNDLSSLSGTSSPAASAGGCG